MRKSLVFDQVIVPNQVFTALVCVNTKHKKRMHSNAPQKNEQMLFFVNLMGNFRTTASSCDLWGKVIFKQKKKFEPG